MSMNAKNEKAADKAVSEPPNTIDDSVEIPSDSVSESIPPSGYSTPLTVEPPKPLDPMQAKRFAFLLGQTDVFAHFIQDLIKDDNLKAEITRQLDSKAAKDQQDGSSR
ncbi:hypothetical protein GGI23_006457, partial [Coemansia sp. RSA 2559]